MKTRGRSRRLRLFFFLHVATQFVSSGLDEVRLKQERRAEEPLRGRRGGIPVRKRECPPKAGSTRTNVELGRKRRWPRGRHRSKVDVGESSLSGPSSVPHPTPCPCRRRRRPQPVSAWAPFHHDTVRRPLAVHPVTAVAETMRWTREPEDYSSRDGRVPVGACVSALTRKCRTSPSDRSSPLALVRWEPGSASRLLSLDARFLVAFGFAQQPPAPASDERPRGPVGLSHERSLSGH